MKDEEKWLDRFALFLLSAIFLTALATILWYVVTHS
jgi:hypothetical protein